MAAVPPPLPPVPRGDAAPTQPTRKRAKKGDPRDVPGAVIHALAHNIMGKHSATHMFGNVNYSRRTFVASLSGHLIVGNLAQRKYDGVSKCDGIFRVNQEKSTIFYDNTT